MGFLPLSATERQRRKGTGSLLLSRMMMASLWRGENGLGLTRLFPGKAFLCLFPFFFRVKPCGKLFAPLLSSLELFSSSPRPFLGVLNRREEGGDLAQKSFPRVLGKNFYFGRDFFCSVRGREQEVSPSPAANAFFRSRATFSNSSALFSRKVQLVRHLGNGGETSP